MLCIFFSHEDSSPPRIQPLHSLLFQALKEDDSLRPEILRSYSANERKFASSPEWIRDLLSRVLHDKPVFIFLDGLDELDEKRRGEAKCREEILQDIFHVVDSCPLVRLLVSSRVESDLKRQLSAKRTLQLRVHENNSDDIKKYVDLECGRLVNRLREFGANEEICSQVQDASAIVVERAGGECKSSSGGSKATRLTLTRDDTLCQSYLPDSYGSWQRRRYSSGVCRPTAEFG